MNTNAETSTLRRDMVESLEIEIERLKGARRQIEEAEFSLLVRARETFENSEAAAIWLVTKQHGLGGQIPLVVAKDTSGMKSVLRILNAIEHGIVL